MLTCWQSQSGVPANIFAPCWIPHCLILSFLASSSDLGFGKSGEQCQLTPSATCHKQMDLPIHCFIHCLCTEWSKTLLQLSLLFAGDEPKPHNSDIQLWNRFIYYEASLSVQLSRFSNHHDEMLPSSSGRDNKTNWRDQSPIWLKFVQPRKWVTSVCYSILKEGYFFLMIRWQTGQLPFKLEQLREATKWCKMECTSSGIQPVSRALFKNMPLRSIPLSTSSLWLQENLH